MVSLGHTFLWVLGGWGHNFFGFWGGWERGGLGFGGGGNGGVGAWGAEGGWMVWWRGLGVETNPSRSIGERRGLGWGGGGPGGRNGPLARCWQAGGGGAERGGACLG